VYREVDEYEKSITLQHRNLDIHRRKDKRQKAEFKHLTLHENLNYVKHNVRNVRQSMRIFKTTNGLFSTPELPAGIIQRISQSPDILTNVKKRELMIVQPEYKAMLKQVNSKAALLDDKNLVDTLYALAKIHKSSKTPLNI